MVKSATYIGVLAAAFGLMAADATAQGRGRGQAGTSDRIQSVRPGTGQARAEARGTTTGDRSIADILLGRDGRDRDGRDRDGRGRGDTRDGSIADILLGRDGRDARDRRDQDRDDRYDDDRRGDDRGPPFCRNGRGHPVHGWRWCADKGFGRDYDRNSDVRILRLPPQPRGDRISDFLDDLARRRRG